MAHLATAAGYHRLVQRLNRYPQGAPPADLLFQILKRLYSERDARLVSLLPIKVFSVSSAAEAFGMRPGATRTVLDNLCDRGLLVDFDRNGRRTYCLPPPMAGFFEFTLMRTRADIDQKALAELYYRYINVEEDFGRALFARGVTQLGRVFIQEPQIPEILRLEVLDHDRVSHMIETAAVIGVSLCYCRHKMAHLHRACTAPMDNCMTLNHVAASLIRHGHARRVSRTEAMELLEQAYAFNLVQFGENVRAQINFICHCCKCCCEAMIAARRFALFHPVHASGFAPVIDPARCTGCGKCVSACPVEALHLEAQAANGRPKAATARLNPQICLGCGVCARTCPSGAVRMAPRPRATITPANTAHRVILMAIERGNLAQVLFDNQVWFSHRALSTLLSVILSLPPIKRALAARQIKSRYIEWLVERCKWQPSLP